MVLDSLDMTENIRNRSYIDQKLFEPDMVGSAWCYQNAELKGQEVNTIGNGTEDRDESLRKRRSCSDALLRRQTQG